MSKVEGELGSFFTDFEGRFDAQLGFVGVSQAVSEELGTSSPYVCRVKVRYDRELMRLLDDGMLLAVRNFRTRPGCERYTLLEVVRFWPEHFGLSAVRDGQYYPIQFEVIQQSVEDWETDDKATMIVQLSAIPINYDLVIDEGHRFVRGFSYPIVGSDVWILNPRLINEMYNGRVIAKLGACVPAETCSDARLDPRLGTVKMFEAAGETIPFYIDFGDLVRYHFGIFAFTGGGKSNLLSNVLRRLLLHDDEVKVVVFDISCEYPFLLMDVLSDPKIPGRVVFENEVRGPEDLYNSVVKPRVYEDDPRVKEGFKEIFDQGKVTFLRRGRLEVPQFSEFLVDIDTMKGENARALGVVDLQRNAQP